MKKINLLSKAEMKKVVGGSMNPGVCRKICPGSTEEKKIQVECVGHPCTVTSTGCIGMGGGDDEQNDVKDCPPVDFS